MIATNVFILCVVTASVPPSTLLSKENSGVVHLAPSHLPHPGSRVGRRCAARTGVRVKRAQGQGRGAAGDRSGMEAAEWGPEKQKEVEL